MDQLVRLDVRMGKLYPARRDALLGFLMGILSLVNWQPREDHKYPSRVLSIARPFFSLTIPITTLLELYCTRLALMALSRSLKF